jgi:seryl-tRNA synthetase
MHSKDFKEYAAKNYAADSVEAILLIHRMENLEVEFERKFRKLALVFWEKHQDPHGRMQVNLPDACSDGVAAAFSRYELDQEKDEVRRQAKALSKEAGKKGKGKEEPELEAEAEEEAEELPKKDATKKKKKGESEES